MSPVNQDASQNDIDPNTSLDSDGFERVEGVRTTERSPDGAPANPGFSRTGTIWFILGSLLSVVALAVVGLVFFGPLIGLLVLALGGVLAVFGNPAIWAAVMRSRERAP